MMHEPRFLIFLISTISLLMFYQVAGEPRLVRFEATYDFIYTSPRTNESDGSKLLKLQKMSDNCLTTLNNETSWVLVDLGFVKSGIVQFRIHANTSKEGSHSYLSDVEIKVSETLPLKSISNLKAIENQPLKICGNTGKVSKITYNVAVNCKASVNARWVLFKKNDSLNLCHIDILLNTVQPQCFYLLKRNTTLYLTASSNVEVFKSMRFINPLDCSTKCIVESACTGYAFVPDSPDTGLCQLVRYKTSSMSKLFCDATCQLFINICHLGQKIKTNISNVDQNIPLTLNRIDIYILSIEINGEILCNENNCGETEILLVDSYGKLNLCGKINSLKYRVLVKEIIFCEKTIKDPVGIIFKTSSNNLLQNYKLKNIYLRVAKEDSFILDIFNQIRNASDAYSNMISTTVIPITTQSIEESLKTNPISTSSFKSVSISKFSSKKFLKESTNSLLYRSSSTINPTVINSNRIISVSNIKSHSKVQSLTSAINTKISTDSTPTTSNSKLDAKFKNPDRNSIYTSIKDSKTQSNRNYTLRKYMISTIMSQNLHTSKLNQLKSTNNSMNYNFLNQSTAPHVWIILVTFVGVLLLVTCIVILVTFLESRHKRKAWDIPKHGLFPLDPASEQITMQSSLFESTNKRVT